jgi:hypothetical protein
MSSKLIFPAIQAAIQARVTTYLSLAAGGAYLGLLHEPITSCDAVPRRRRPVKYGTAIPSVSSRGITTSRINIADVKTDREDCPMCKKFGSGPCGDTFKRWLACTDQHPGKDAKGEPVHITKCLDFAEKLSECLDKHSEYYTKYDENTTKEVGLNESNELEEAWADFVRETEEQIAVGKYKSVPFPAEIEPTMQVRLELQNGATYFKLKMQNDASIIVAYILDDKGNVLAAGSMDDMDMGKFGCVLIFDVSAAMKSATCKAIYDEGTEYVTVYSKTLLVPANK